MVKVGRVGILTSLDNIQLIDFIKREKRQKQSRHFFSMYEEKCGLCFCASNGQIMLTDPGLRLQSKSCYRP